MPEKIEELLKKIHVLFANSEHYRNSEDKIIVSKQEVFDILEEMNYAIYEMLDQYEQTQVSKDKAKTQLEKETSRIIDDSNKHAEDIYAASILFSDKMLSEVKKSMLHQIQKVQEEYRLMEHFLDTRVSSILRNRDELHEQLQDMVDGRMYMKLVEEQRKREEEKLKDLEEAAKLKDGKKVKSGQIKSDYKNEKDFYEGDIDESEDSNGLKIVVNHNQVEKVRKATSGEETEKKPEKISDKKEKTESPESPEKTGTVYTANDFDLDKEYYDWKGGHVEEETEADGIKKKIQTIFKKNK